MSDLVLAPVNRVLLGWKEDPVGKRFAEAIISFLISFDSKHTRRAYAHAFGEFWDWYAYKHDGASPTPDRVERPDAWAYVDHLRHPDPGFAEHRMMRRSPEDAACYSAVQLHPGATAREVARKRGLDVEAAEARLLWLVAAHVLVRQPTVAETRASSGTSDLLAILAEPSVDLYRYYLASAPPHGHPSTLEARLAALAGLWDHLARTGENTGRAALLAHNIWREPLSRVAPQARGRKAATRVTKTPTPELFIRLLATTFQQTHPSTADEDTSAGPLRAARAAWDGLDADSTGTEYPSLLDLRDRALLLWIAGTGCRADEVGTLRLRDLTSDGLVTIVGKGGRTRVVRVPESCLRALHAYQRALLPVALRRPTPRQKRLLGALLEPTAPLSPAVRLWGRNAGRPERGLSREGIHAMLGRRARQAGIEPGTEDWARCHPHGLRHLAAKRAVAAGVDLHVVQAALGHESLSTTGIYVEEHDPSRICLVPEKPVEQGPVGGAKGES